MTNIEIKRVYEEPSEDDGYRVLVDKLWPRGVGKTDAKLDKWWKEVAPSTELRKWFDHDPEKWDNFSERYYQELKKNTYKIDAFLQNIDQRKRVTLLYGAKDEKHNHALVLKRFLEKR